MGKGTKPRESIVGQRASKSGTAFLLCCLLSWASGLAPRLVCILCLRYYFVICERLSVGDDQWVRNGAWVYFSQRWCRPVKPCKSVHMCLEGLVSVMPTISSGSRNLSATSPAPPFLIKSAFFLFLWRMLSLF